MWMKRELIDEKVNDNCIFISKNKIRTKTRIQVLVMFHHVILIIANKKFPIKS